MKPDLILNQICSKFFVKMTEIRYFRNPKKSISRPNQWFCLKIRLELGLKVPFEFKDQTTFFWKSRSLHYLRQPIFFMGCVDSCVSNQEKSITGFCTREQTSGGQLCCEAVTRWLRQAVTAWAQQVSRYTWRTRVFHLRWGLLGVKILAGGH
jgi:hypothetical protein